MVISVIQQSHKQPDRIMAKIAHGQSVAAL